MPTSTSLCTPLAMMCLSGLLTVAAEETTAIPDWVIAGIAAVETSSLYRHGELVVYRDQRDGTHGEVGPWQLSPEALLDLGARRLTDRIRHEPLLAESMTRAWLLRCYARSRDWMTAVAQYHAGPHGTARTGRDYADRVLAAGVL